MGVAFGGIISRLRDLERPQLLDARQRRRASRLDMLGPSDLADTPLDNPRSVHAPSLASGPAEVEVQLNLPDRN